METKQYKRKIIVKNTDEDFGLGEGILVEQFIGVPVNYDWNDPMNIVNRTDSDMEFLNQHIEVVWEEISEFPV